MKKVIGWALVILLFTLPTMFVLISKFEFWGAIITLGIALLFAGLIVLAVYLIFE